MEDKPRAIIHVDMDAYYAAIEQRDDPELRGKPVCVGGGPDGRGVVTTCSYEARKFGIHSAMGSHRAYRLCPEAIFVSPRFDVYVAVSKQIRKIFHEFSDIVEPLSLDEAFLDVTEGKSDMESPEEIAKEILRRIHEETGLTASAGVSFNKFLAKVGSDFNKPNGITVIKREEADEFIDNLPIRKFIGVGKVTERRMKAHGIETGADLKQYSKDELRNMFGKAGAYFYYMAHGMDSRTVGHRGSRRSIGSETTLREDLDNTEKILEVLEEIAARLTGRMNRYHIRGRTITLKVKYHDFKRITRSTTGMGAVDNQKVIMRNIRRMVPKTNIGKTKVRLVGISVTNLVNQSDIRYRQLKLPIRFQLGDSVKTGCDS
jgi:DNA polymerase-4